MIKPAILGVVWLNLFILIWIDVWASRVGFTGLFALNGSKLGFYEELRKDRIDLMFGVLFGDVGIIVHFWRLNSLFVR